MIGNSRSITNGRGFGVDDRLVIAALQKLQTAISKRISVACFNTSQSPLPVVCTLPIGARSAVTAEKR